MSVIRSSLAVFFAPIFLLSLEGAAQIDPPHPIRRGRITLPPRPAQDRNKPAPSAVVRSDAEQFARDVRALRVGRAVDPGELERILLCLERDYEDPAGMAVRLAIAGRLDQMPGLLKIVERFGDLEHADELHFQILSRPLGVATAPMIECVVRLLEQATPADNAAPLVGAAAPAVVETASRSATADRLFVYLTARYAPVRRTAAAMLAGRIGPGDAPALLALTRHEQTDVRRQAIDLLGRLPLPAVRERLVQVLELEPKLSGDACDALLAHGASVAPALVEVVTGVPAPGQSRGFGYAAYALAELEARSGQPVLTVATIPPLLEALGKTDPFLTATSAIALGTLAYRLGDWGEHEPRRRDAPIVDGLLSVAAPEAFVSSLDRLQPAALRVLVKLSGRNFRADGAAWRGWWDGARDGFVCLRQDLEVDTQRRSHALLTWQTEDHHLAFRGVDVPDEVLPTGARAYVLGDEQIGALLERLTAVGFMEPGNDPPQVPDVWVLDLRIGGDRAMMRIPPSRQRGDRSDTVHRLLVETARKEMWQQHRDTERQPDAVVFWREEQKWLAAHPDQGEHTARLIHHILARLPALDVPARRAALDDLQSVPDLPRRITPQHAGVLIGTVEKLPKLEAGDFRMVEIALLADDEESWKSALNALEHHMETAPAANVARIFEMLGPERVVLAVRHPDPDIAVAAMRDAAAQRNIGAVPALIERLKDRDGEVVRNAVFTLGALHATQARDLLIDLEPGAHPVIRREIWKALGRLGGRQVPDILQRAMELPVPADKLAALTAMGSTQSEELARFLAVRFVGQGPEGDEFGQRAEASLRQMGPDLAVSALQPHLTMKDGPARNRLVLLLGDFHDPRVVPDLIRLLDDPKNGSGVAALLAEITGVNVPAINERSSAMLAWYTVHRAEEPGQWYLAALRDERIPTTLRAQSLTPNSGVGAVPELTRLLLGIELVHLRVMTATMLRATTGKDFTRGVRYAKPDTLAAIADRYRIHAEAEKAALK